MANISKAEREKREAEKEAQLKAEIEEKIRKEYEEKLKSSTSTVVETTSVKKKKIPLDTMIPVKSGVNGILVYVSRKTGYEITWEEYGAIEYVEMSDLLAMRNTDKSFYENNWIYFEDTDEYSSTDCYKFLDVYKYYDESIVGNDLNSLFLKEPDEIKAICEKLSKGLRNTVASLARTKIDDGTLDSNKRISALEEVLDIELSSK
jgi:hypothetical protein